MRIEVYCTRASAPGARSRARSLRAGGAPQGDAVPVYPGTCRRLSASEREARIAAGADYALRLDVGEATARTGSLEWSEDGRTLKARPETLGDVVLARKDVPVSYHLAVTVDDAQQGVTLVTRGADLFTTTHVHRLLQALLGLPTPAYRHHPLLTDASGRRLAKRDEATTVRDMRRAGVFPREIIRRAQLSA